MSSYKRGNPIRSIIEERPLESTTDKIAVWNNTLKRWELVLASSTGLGAWARTSHDAGGGQLARTIVHLLNGADNVAIGEDDTDNDEKFHVESNIANQIIARFHNTGLNGSIEVDAQVNVQFRLQLLGVNKWSTSVLTPAGGVTDRPYYSLFNFSNATFGHAIFIDPITGFMTINATTTFTGGDAKHLPHSNLQVNGSQAHKRLAITANRTLDGTDYYIGADTTGGVLTVTLPTAVGIEGREYIIKDEGRNAGTNTITIATTSSQLIDGQSASTFNIVAQDGLVRIMSDGQNWRSVG